MRDKRWTSKLGGLVYQTFHHDFNYFVCLFDLSEPMPEFFICVKYFQIDACLFRIHNGHSSMDLGCSKIRQG